MTSITSSVASRLFRLSDTSDLTSLLVYNTPGVGSMTSWNDLSFELKCSVTDQILINAAVSSCKGRSTSYGESNQYLKKTEDPFGVMRALYHGGLLWSVRAHGRYVDLLLTMALEETLGCTRNFFAMAPEMKEYVKHELSERNVVEPDGKWVRLFASEMGTPAREMQADVLFRLLKWCLRPEKLA